MSENGLALILGRLRYVSFIAVVSAGLSSVLMFIIGAFKTYSAYAVFINSALSVNPDASVKQAIAYLVQGIDAFLIALVFLIFSKECKRGKVITVIPIRRTRHLIFSTFLISRRQVKLREKLRQKKGLAKPAAGGEFLQIMLGVKTS